MTGIMSAGIGSGQNVIFAPGTTQRFYSGYAGTNTAFFDSQIPFSTVIDAGTLSFSNSSSSSISVLWQGYFRPTATGTATFTLSISIDDADNYNFLWVGPAARSGYSAGNALINGFGSGNLSVIAGQYYPLRLQLAYDGDGGLFNDPFINFNLLVDGSTSYSTFYNSLTTGI
jgi:hypothetical protein